MDNIGYLILFCLLFVGVYLYFTIHDQKTKADLTEAVTIIMSAVGIFSSIELGYIAIVKVSAFTGDLENQRVQIMIGAFAILWVSIQAIYKICSKHYKCCESVLIEQS